MEALLLRVRGVVKRFHGLTALDDVSLDVHSGEIVAVLGHNGSGKSTLVKVLAGVYAMDAGEIALADSDSGATELHFIHQDLALISELSAVENFHLDRGSGVGALKPNHRRAEYDRAAAVIGRFGQSFDLDAPLRSLTPAQRTIIAIARALDSWTHRRNVLVLDEPTESLHKSEVNELFATVRRLAADGAGIVFISHRLDEVMELADRVVVLRQGQKVAAALTREVSSERLIELITGAPQHSSEPQLVTDSNNVPILDAPVLSVRGLRGVVLDGLDLDLVAGEIVGVTGILGSGREELASALFGASPATAQRFQLAGTPYRRRSPAASIRRGMALVPADRARLGSIRPMSARENVTLPELRSLRTPWGAVHLLRERGHVAGLISRYDVKPPRPEQTFALFSGGNQQKLVMARWLRNSPAVLMLEEPTQGVDIGAKTVIYDAIRSARDQGAAILVCSSDAKELIQLCGRVIVLRDGAVVEELTGAQLTEHHLLLHSYGIPIPEEDDD